VAVSKNIVLCLDGTGNELRAKGNTNVVRLYEMLSLDDSRRQVAFYDPGLGTFGAKGALTPIARRFTKLLGLAAGYGMRTNLADAYTYLMQTYDPGDRIFIFGFSRGSYTARALAGMLHLAGLIRPGAENLVPYAIQVYARSKKNWTPEDWNQTHRFADAFCIEVNGSRSIPIHFLGIWDSVKAAGILRWNLKWPYTRKIPNVDRARHAVAIDEKRRPYKEYLVQPQSTSQDVREVWFAGVHSDVGGTFEDDHRLADISLKWMVEQAIEAELRVNMKAFRETCVVSIDNARGKVHRMGWVWVFLTYRKRPITPSNARIHASVGIRMESDPSYRLRASGETIVWDDPQWAEVLDDG
jgi:uncharacterized protein (DUF2235 family)